MNDGIIEWVSSHFVRFRLQSAPAGHGSAWGALMMLMALYTAVGCRNAEDSSGATKIVTDNDSGIADSGIVAALPDPSEPMDESPQTPLDRDEVIAKAEDLEQRNDLTAAESVLKTLLVVDPTDYEIVFRLAGLSASRGDLDAAVERLKSIPENDPIAGLPALGQAADWCFELDRFADAEAGYLKILASIPDATEAHRKLAYLYNRQGRRYEAALHVRALCRQGDVRQDELHSLIQLSDAMFDPPSESPRPADTFPYYPIGPSAIARHLFSEERFQEAVDVLRDSVVAQQQPASIVAFFGRAAAEAQDDASFHWWLANVNEDLSFYPEYWAAIGTWSWAGRDPESAVRAFLEAMDREPTDFRSIVRLRAALIALGRTDEAEVWSERWKTLRDISQVNNRIADAAQPDVTSMLRLAELLSSIDRELEAVLWKSIALSYQQASMTAVDQLRSELARIVTDDSGFPDRSSRICGMRIDEFPLPNIKRVDTNISHSNNGAPGTERDASHRSPAAFANIADSIGLTHAFHVASKPQDRGFSVYQSVGGAIAVLDYDLDGHSDLYLTQGGSDPPDFVGPESNVLYRNLGTRLTDVTTQSAARQDRYSTGVTAGDWNQDGFVDIAVANVGQNSLYLNSGDGTFLKIAFDDRDDKTLLTTSLAMADLTGDAIPDVFELNYLHDPAFSKRPATNDQGEVVGYLKPAEFNPGLDRVIQNDGTGQPSFHAIGGSQAAASGLGVIVGDFDDRHPGNEVFVGNDTDPNQLWIRQANTQQWTDVAMVRGCAFGFDGVPTASMGVAAGDFDQNGLLDFHVTNFQDENVSLFLNQDGVYQDRSVGFGLAQHSSSVLGFGTQAIDFDNDSGLDLVVTNGHIEQSAAIPHPFKQPLQLFRNHGTRFEWVAVNDPSGYCNKPHVGRGLARLDFDRDGRTDFAVTHLGETTALLINQTESPNHWIQFQLIGTTSERDAIGARIEIQMPYGVRTHWMLAGDGFFSRNEAVLAFGLGNHAQVDAVLIRWPSGHQTRIDGLAADHRWLVVEGESQAFQMW